MARPSTAAPTFTGLVPADFTEPGVLLLDDGAAAPDVGMPAGSEGATSGWDIKGVRLFHDPLTDVLYVGIETFGIAGDADGDGAEGGTSAWLAASLGTDLPQLAESESAALLFDLDGDGLFDVIAGVPGDRALGDFTVSRFAGVPSAPAFAFGEVLGAQAMGAYTSGPPSAASPHLEFAIPHFSELPGFAGAFRMQAFMGSFADAGIGDDRLPDSGSALICLDADHDGYTTCDGDCNDRLDSVNPAILGDPFCDGIDDDCDGETDEDFGGLGAPTECGNAPVCQAQGMLLCVDGQIIDTCLPGDNGVFVPETTTCGVGACASTGTTTCATGDVTDTCTPGEPAASDPCNGVDDDCDGITDEDFVSASTSCGLGVCQRDGATSCVGGVVVNDCLPGPPAGAETCDGEDEDCDGETDEDAALPPAPTCGEGACATVGTIQCVSGTLVETCEPGNTDVEICDGVDNDCDGETDEDPQMADPEPCGVGACAAVGTVSCIEGEEIQTCVAGDPTPELCDGVDNDCDGAIDEDVQLPAPPTCGLGACRAVGTVSCVDGALVETCQALRGSAEVCDAIDNDCDGDTDEDVELPPAPTCGQGGCFVQGTSQCLRGEIVTSCVPGRAHPEQCDGVDNDCDGETDEDAALPPAPTCGQGACAATGTVSCEGGEVVQSCEAGQPGAETCNGVDDDCDGDTDEDVVLGPAPTCGEGACATTGTIACVGGEVVESCEATTATPETCNGVDDDCDGAIDEDVVLGAPPTCGEGACAATGTIACVGGEVVESCEPGAGGPEACNGIDDDCDGDTDEDVVLGAPPTCGEGACAATGTIACVGGEVVESCEPGAGRPEACNGIDDDCDGDTDEDVVLGAPPTCGEGVCAATGTIACVGGEVVESCEPGAIGDAHDGCDGVDSDCDGETDEDFVGEQTECGVGACAGRGVTACLDGAVVDSCRIGEPADDDATCDEVDDDCDGEIDEDCGFCGDGVVQPGEDCDDGNEAYLDGCTPSCQVEQCPLVLDFDMDAHGDAIVAGQDLSMAWIDSGIAISAYKKTNLSSPAPPVAFDSAHPTGGDTDLGTPNKALGGPGVGTGGKSTNAVARAMIAIVPENVTDKDGDGLVDSPDDNGTGGALVFEFASAVCLDAVGILDNDSSETITLKAYSADGDLLSTDQASALGDNSYEEIGVGTCGVYRLVVTLTGSGSVTHLAFCPDTTEVCDGLDNDGDGSVDEDDACGCPLPDAGRTYVMSAAHNDECHSGTSTHAIHIPGFFDGDPNHVVRFTFEDDARFEWDPSGETARFYGTAKVYSLGGGAGDMGSEWFVDVALDYQGRGAAGQGTGGPKKEMASCQPTATTDTWDYFDFAPGLTHIWRVSNPLDVAALTMYPAHCEFPLQLGMAANNKNGGLGFSSWFSFEHTEPGRAKITGKGDFNVDLDCP
ncbi:MAG: hypothetical protein H6746_11760 [Deltaproteobacteria bacterium]|nr:hypothetical protein [Deltaproteobacteria bacterium]